MLVNLADDILGVTESAKATAAFGEFQPDLVLLDLHMPPPDGSCRGTWCKSSRVVRSLG